MKTRHFGIRTRNAGDRREVSGLCRGYAGDRFAAPRIVAPPRRARPRESARALSDSRGLAHLQPCFPHKPQPFDPCVRPQNTAAFFAGSWRWWGRSHDPNATEDRTPAARTNPAGFEKSARPAGIATGPSCGDPAPEPHDQPTITMSFGPAPRVLLGAICRRVTASDPFSRLFFLAGSSQQRGLERALRATTVGHFL